MKKYRPLNAARFPVVATSLFLFYSLFQSTVIAEEMPVDSNSLRSELENAGWKSLQQRDGAVYLFPAGHPYADLGQAANGEWTDIPPPNAIALSTIVKQLEMQGYLPIVEIEFEDGAWEVEAYRHGRLVEFLIDPVSGKMTESVDDD